MTDTATERGTNAILMVRGPGMFVTHNDEPLIFATRHQAGLPLIAPTVARLPHERLAAIFRRLTYEISGDLNTARVLFCEHPVSVTVGRHGSVTDVRGFPHDTVQYVARGGRCIPHGPGQLGIYPVFPLDRWHISPAAHVAKLLRTAVTIARRFDVAATIVPEEAYVLVGSRVLAAVGVAVHRGVSSYGLLLNVNPDLESFSAVRVHGESMTSLVRESPIRVPYTDIPNIAMKSLFKEFPAFHYLGFDAPC